MRAPEPLSSLSSENVQKEIVDIHVPILLICRCGNRSLEAGKVLIQAGFSHVYNIIEGFEGPLDASHHRSTLGGWRVHDLPWEQC